MVELKAEQRVVLRVVLMVATLDNMLAVLTVEHLVDLMVAL